MVIQFDKYINFSELVENSPAKFYFFGECCILIVMNQNKRKKLPLYFIMLGSGILAIPASLGTYFLLYAAIESFTKKIDNLALLLPVALIGYFLLFGYFWTAATKKFVKWFWVISAIYNLLLTLVGGYFVVEMTIETIDLNKQIDISLLLTFFLFSSWTLFVTIASVKYAFYKSKTDELNLP